MAKPILVGYDANTSDRAPVLFGVAAARFTSAPLIVATVGAAQADADGFDAAQLEEDLLTDASEALARVGADLESEGIAIEVRRLESTSAARALYEAAENRGRRSAGGRLDAAGRRRPCLARVDR
jgi:hypothetical protein